MRGWHLVVDRPTIGIATIITSERGISAMPDCVAVKPSSSCMNTGSRNMIDISIANMTPPMSVPDRNTGSLNRRRFTAGTVRGELADDEGDERDDGDAARSTVMSARLEPVVAAAFLEHVLQRGEADAHAARCPTSRGSCAASRPRRAVGARMSSGSCTKRVTMKSAEDADRQVDVEDPRPAVVVDDVAAERRAERPGRRMMAMPNSAIAMPCSFGRERLAQDGLLGGLQRAGAEALDDAEDDEHRQRAREAAQRRADDEQHEADQVDALLAEEAAEEPGERHHEHRRDDEAGGDPGDLLDRRAERAADVRERDVDDRRVDGAHQRAEGDRERDQPLVDRRPCGRARLRRALCGASGRVSRRAHSCACSLKKTSAGGQRRPPSRRCRRPLRTCRES